METLRKASFGRQWGVEREIRDRSSFWNMTSSQVFVFYEGYEASCFYK